MGPREPLALPHEKLPAPWRLLALTVAAALESDDPNVGKLKVIAMLESLPGLGKVKARKIMEEVGIADNRKIQGLGTQQKKTLLEHLAK